MKLINAEKLQQQLTQKMNESENEIFKDAISRVKSMVHYAEGVSIKPSDWVREWVDWLEKSKTISPIVMQDIWIMLSKWEQETEVAF